MEKVLVADDELSMREFLEILLHKEGYAVETASTGEEAIKKIERDQPDLIICDIMMPKVNGMDVLRKAKEIDPEALVIMITAYASTESAVEAMKLGAYDYITKPFQVDQIKLVVKKALEHVQLVRENIRLKREVESKYVFENLIGASEPMQKVYEVIRRVAPTKSNVLISGESGTGKELVAKAIHYNSPRRDLPFITVNCGAIPSELLESELFGHLKGAFTGAYGDKRGLFEAANKSTIFLDEIGEIPGHIQVKLLRVIQDKTFKPLGSVKDVNVDVRLIAATNRDLEIAVKQGIFREDLYYRLNVIQIHVPPLRERRDDVPLLIQHFIRNYNIEIGKEIKGIVLEAEKLLLAYDWPGNVRELENTIERAISLTQSEKITVENLPGAIRLARPESISVPSVPFPDRGIELETILENMERDLILKALERSGGVKNKAAKMLGISFRSFRYRLKKLGLDFKDN